MERDFHQEQQYEDRMATCRALVSHLQKISIATHTPLDTEEEAAPQQAVTPPLERAPLRAESDPSTKPGSYILRRDKDEMFLVPSSSSLTRKRSKKEKRRNTPIVKVLYTYIQHCLIIHKKISMTLIEAIETTKVIVV